MPTYPSNWPNITIPQFVQRIIQVLPQAWWSQAALVPGGVTYVVLLAIATSFYYHKNNQLDYTVLQTRILTATGLNLENISYDFFGTNLPRLPGESDSAYAARIISNIETPRATIAAIQAACNFYFSNVWVPPYSILYPLFGLDVAGGFSTRGGLSNPDGIVQELPSVVIWDQQSDPTDAATYNITPPYFVVDVDYPIRNGTGWALHYSALGYNTCLFNYEMLEPIPGTIDPGLVAVVDLNKAEGCIPVYMFHRSIGATTV